MPTPNNEFHNAFSKQEQATKKRDAKMTVVKRLFAHMVDISADPNGSDPANYFSPQDTETIAQFVEAANSERWPNGVKIHMQSPRISDIPAWNDRRRTAKAPLTKALLFKDVGEAHSGHHVGKLSILPSQQVAICSDGLLRSLRGPELDKSFAVGWGRLPDADLLAAALGVDSAYGVSHSNASSRSLAERLAANLGHGASAHH